MRRLFAILVVALLVAVCGAASADAACPARAAQMGCSSQPNPGARTVLPTSSSGPSGEWIPDVSSYQLTVNWAAVKGWEISRGAKLTGGIFKLGEYVPDPHALQNATDLHRDGMIAIGYWFIRPISPYEEAGKILAEAAALHIHVIVLDEEVAGIQGYAKVIAPILQKAGYKVVDYHSSENVLDTSADGLPCWVAAYGPSRPPACTTGKRVAWQWTDAGSVPGVTTGSVDLSVSYGLLKLAEPAKPPRLVCFGKGATPSSIRCKPIVTHHAWLVDRRIHWGRVMHKTRAGTATHKHAVHWFYVRRGQAVRLERRYS
jgi:GH25 family lysozyme M1 (1,4-beta-N-acetylmuramidase)